MRHLPALLLLLAACSGEKPPPPDVAVAKQMIWEAIKNFHKAGDEADPSRQLTYTTKDVSLIHKADDVLRGQAAVEKVLEAWADKAGSEKPKTLVGQEEIRVEGADLAYVTYLANSRQLNGVVTAIFKRVDGKWLIAHLHDTRAAAPAK
jgi:ketosteroid isomerase-like protein